MPGRHGELVGQTLSKSLYKLGNIKFTIVGVFREPDRFEEKCLNSFGAEIDGMYYSSDTVSGFLEDKTALDDCNQRAYCLLFDSYSDLSDFLADHKELIDGKDGQRLVYSDRLAMITEEELITFTSIAFLPLSLLIAMFTVLFYTSLIKTEVSFNGKFISRVRLLRISGEEGCKLFHAYTFPSTDNDEPDCICRGICTGRGSKSA